MLTRPITRPLTRPITRALVRRSSAFDPLTLFSEGQQGAWYDPSDLTTLFQDAAGTTPVTADGDPVGLMLDKSGNDNHASQSTTAAKPTYRTDGTLHWLEGDGADDFLRTPLLTLNLPGIYIGIAMAVSAGNENPYPGPFRFLRDGGLDTEGSDNILESFVEGINYNFRNQSYVQRYESTKVFTSATPDARPDVGISHVDWFSIDNSGNQVLAGIIPTSPLRTGTPRDSLTSGQATLDLFRGYSGNNLKGRIHQFIWREGEVTEDQRDKANEYLAAKAGVTLP